jgi:hypothetical protein
MLASDPASMVNQKYNDLGIPNRFNLTPSRFSVANGVSPAARCAAIKQQCGGKFYANYCGDKLLSAM